MDTPSAKDIDNDLLDFDEARLKLIIRRHLKYTKSEKAKSILDDWNNYLNLFYKITPFDFKRALKERKQKIKEDNNVDITMTLTTPNCPEAQTIPEKVADVVSLLKGVNEVKVEITWDPPWTQDNMTDAAKLELGLM